MTDHRLARTVRDAMKAVPEAQALRFEDRWYSWAELDAAGQAILARLAAAGIDPAAPVALVVRNRPSSYAALLGLLGAARPIQMVYSYQAPEALARDIRRREAAAVVAEAGDWSAPLLDAARGEGCCGISLDERTLRATLIEGLEHVQTPAAQRRLDPQIVMLTSGTTGEPKACRMSYDTVAQAMLGDSMMFPKDRVAGIPSVLLYYSLGNVSGLYGMIPAVAQGRTAMLVEKFSLDSWVDFVRSYRPESVTIPTVGVRLALEADVDGEYLASLKFVWSGAAQLPHGTHEAFEKRYGIPILLGYGATEFGGAATSMTLEDREVYGDAKMTSIGRPWRDTELRIVDPETGAPLPADTVGLIEVHAPAVGQDWIRTTDLGRIDADGFVYHTGRADGAINRGGFKILPHVVEQALALHPAVAGACVVGIPDERLGEVPAAAVEVRQGHALPSEADLQQLVREQLTAIQVPTRIRIVAAIPRTQSMKASLPDVRRLFADGLSG